MALCGRAVLGISNTPQRDASLARADGVAVAFSGQLDNLRDLERLLPPDDEPAPPVSPAGVVLRAFLTYREGAASIFRGAFAAVVTDGSTLWCFRDHVGWGQLFYRDEHERVYVATEAKQVVAGAGIAPEPDLEVVERLFYGQYEPEMSGGLRGVMRVPRATVLSFDGRRVRRRRYWDPEPLLETAKLSADDVKARFGELMTQAVARTLSGHDVVSLSGGIDSPAVVTFGAPIHMELSGRPITALSAYFPKFPDVDESTYIEAVCEQLAIPLHSYEPTAGALDGLERWISLCDGPLPELPPGEVEEHYRRAHQLGFTTMLTGDQAELIFDLPRYVLPHLLRTRRFAALSPLLRQQRERGASLRSIVRHLSSAFVPRAAVAMYRRHGRWADHQIPTWLDKRRVKEPAARFAVGGGDQWREEQLAFVRAPGVGMDADDVLQAVCGVRQRRPWADVDLYEFFLSLPAEVKYPDLRAKSLVRTLLRGTVHDVILDRWQKTSFNAQYLAEIDYEALRGWLTYPKHRLAGVDYDVLAQRLERESLDIIEYKWVIDLAKSHVFLAQW